MGNELNPKPHVGWRQRMENQRCAILATEIKNNACKVAKWATLALMSGVDLLKIGYVIRDHPQKNDKHSLISVQTLKTREFASNINISLDNSWGIVKAVLDPLCKLEDGEYLLVREPQMPFMRIYRVTTDYENASKS